MLRRWTTRPRLATSVVAALAVGIGGAVGVFSVLHALVLKALPWPAADRLAVIHAVSPHQRLNPATADTWNRAPVGWDAWEALATTSSFEKVGAWMPGRQILDVADAGASVYSEAVAVIYASTAYLELLGAKPFMGRLFTEDEDRNHASDSVVLPYETWKRLFGGRPDVLGRPIRLRPALQFRGSQKTVVGVLPADLEFPQAGPVVVLPIGLQSWNARFSASGFLRVLARLAPGVATEEAMAAVEPVVRGVQPPDRRSARLVPLRDELLGRFVPSLWLLFAGSAILLTMSLAVSAGLLAEDAALRRREIAVRHALGASWTQLARQIVSEQLILTAAAVVIGLAIARQIAHTTVAVTNSSVSMFLRSTLDVEVAAVAGAVVLLVLLVLSLTPLRALAWQRRRGGRIDAGRQATRYRSLLEKSVVGGVVALAIVLTTGAVVFADAVLRVRSEPLGFNPARLVVVAVTPAALRERITSAGRRDEAHLGGLPSVRSPVAGSAGAGLAIQAWRQSWLHTADLVTHLSGLSGVKGVAAAFNVPFSDRWSPALVRSVNDPTGGEHEVQVLAVTESYFDVMEMPLMAGRVLRREDRSQGRAVVSETFSKQFLTGDGVGGAFLRDGRRYAVVGVVGDVRHRAETGLDGERACFYVLDSTIAHVNYLVIRTERDHSPSPISLKEAIQEFNPGMLVTSGTAMADLIMREFAERVVRSRVSLVLAVASLLLAVGGLFGLLRRQVAERRQEIGVRLALGARPRDLYGLIAREAGRTLTIGLALGLTGSIVVVRVVAAHVDDTSSSLLLVLTVSPAVTLAIALLATVGPARRAARVDPLRALQD